MKVIIGQGSCGIATGAKKTQAAFEEQIEKQDMSKCSQTELRES